MRKKIDMEGKQFGKWTVIKEVGKSKHGEYMWLCRCACGAEGKVGGKNLRKGHSTKCGLCKRAGLLSGDYNRKHGKSNSREYTMFKSAKKRAAKLGIPFNISVDDIVIPEYCPLLGCELSHGEGKLQASSPSLDKIDPTKGYVKDNIWVISFRANAIKHDSTLEELERLVFNLRNFIKERH